MEARLHKLLGVELLHADAVVGHVCDEADEVVFGHGMVERDVPVVFHALDRERVRVVFGRLFGFARRKVHAAARKRPFAHGVDDVSTDRAHVEFAAQHIARPVGVLAHVARQKLGDRYAERFGQVFDKRDIGQAAARFPFGNGLVGHADPLGELPLGEPARLAQVADGIRGQVGAHGMSFRVRFVVKMGA